MVEPEKSKLTSYLATLREKHDGPSIISIGDLRAFVEEHSEAAATNPDTAYVSHSFFEIDHADINKSTVRIVLTTKRLIDKALEVKAKDMHTDATYKLNVNGYPVLVVGFSDKVIKYIVIKAINF